MAAKSHRLFNYVGHIQKADGSVTELAGSKEDYNMENVRQWLWRRAQEIGGWLLNDSITESGAEPEEKEEKKDLSLYVQAEENDYPAIGDALYWIEYKGEHYAGASRLEFKESKDG